MEGSEKPEPSDGSTEDGYLGELDVEEHRLLGAGHLNPVPAAGGLLLLRVSARLHRRRHVSPGVMNEGDVESTDESMRGFDDLVAD